MKNIKYEDLVGKIEDLILQTSYNLPSDVYEAIKKSKDTEESTLGKSILEKLLINADIARDEKLPICQDTGSAVFFVEIGRKTNLQDIELSKAIYEATANAYRKGYLRSSIVIDPVYNRKNSDDNTPPIIHYELTETDYIKIQFAAKGGGAENMSGLAMLKPLDGEDGVVNFVCELVKKAYGNPCPPIVIGIGIGGNFEYSCYLAKKALLREIGQKNPDPDYARLEKKILDAVNSLGIGPQGLGGRVTALAVHILTYPCHIASLPVAVNLNCHVSRHGYIII